MQGSAAEHAALVQRLASWGVATLQPRPGVLTVPTELALLQGFPSWLDQQAAEPSSPLGAGAVDPERLVVGGYSRGGKLAALLFADNPQAFKAAYLVDPDDSATAPFPRPPPEDNPLAAAALLAAGVPVGLSSGGVAGRCCPVDTCRGAFWPAAGNGSWLSVLPGASHSTFVSGGVLVDAASDLLCGKGGDSREEVVTLTATPMLAWLWQQLQGEGGGGGGASPMPAFEAFVAAQESAGMLQFEVKGGDGEGELPAAAVPEPEPYRCRRLRGVLCRRRRRAAS